MTMSKKLPLAWLVLVSLSLPLAASGQSLGSVAKKERERRDKNKQEGVSAREFTEEEVFGESATESETVEGEAEGSETPPEDPMPVVKEDAPPGAEGSDARERESRERKRSEAEWRSRAAKARERIAIAQKRVQYFEELYLGPNEYYVDANGNKVYESADQLQRLTREAKEELAAAEKDWKAMQEEARRGGVPPGWLR
jgi:hypothetical protein